MEIYEVNEFSTGAFEAAQGLVVKLGPATEPMTEEYFRAVIASPCSHLFFLADGQTVAGMLTVGIYPTPSGVKAWIEDVVVDPSFRGQGLGRRIVAHALEFAKNRGITAVMLTSNPSRIAANALYRAMGFEQKQTNVYVYKT